MHVEADSPDRRNCFGMATATFLCLSSALFLLDKIEPGIYLMKKTKVGEKLKAHSPQVCETNSLKTEGIYFSIIAVGKADLPILCDM